MAEPEETPAQATDEPEPAPVHEAYRPAFSKNYPREPELDQLVQAFVDGNYARVFTEAPRLARSTEDPEVAQAALDLHRRTRPDPLALAMLGGTGALLLLLILWFYTHRHVH